MIEELIDKLNDLKILQKSIDWREDIPDDIWFKYLEEAEYLDLELDVDKHRHYELSTDVFMIYDEFPRYLGIRRISNLYSEMSDCEDIHHTLEFFQMKQTKTITYEKI